MSRIFFYQNTIPLDQSLPLSSLLQFAYLIKQIDDNYELFMCSENLRIKHFVLPKLNTCRILTLFVGNEKISSLHRKNTILF